MLNLAERQRGQQGWSLRSALVRFAQPEPTRAAAVLDLVRRCEWALQPLLRTLEASTVIADRALRPDALGEEPAAPYPDARAVDLARLLRHVPDPTAKAAVVDAYGQAGGELTADERGVLPLLEAVLVLDELADTLAAWAPSAPHDPPEGPVDEVCRQLHPQLEALGVTAELDPARQGRRGRQGSGRRGGAS